MPDLTVTEKTIRIMEVEGDKDSDQMAAAVKHIMQKTGPCTNYRYIVKGPNYSCALENNGAGWAIVDYDNRDAEAVAPSTTDGDEEDEDPKSVTVTSTEEGQEQSTATTSGTDSIIYNEPGR